MDQQILNSTITIEEVIDKEKKLSLKAHDGNRSFTYSIWKTKQDGSDTSAYAQFKNMGLTQGSTVMVGYVIDEYETEINGFPKKIQSKKIINFRETNELPQTPPQGLSSNGGANRDLPGHSSDAFGRRLAIHGFVNGMLAAGATIETIKKDLHALVKLEDEIDNALAGREVGAGLPTIQVENDTDKLAEDIPF
jgi:hypothetical protein